MRYKKRTFILLVITILTTIVLSFYYYTDPREDVVHLKNDNKEFKIRPENSIESTISHREKEVYDHALRSN
ncbi:hypothetical protein HET73_01035 [Wolbachia endosymbiont of Atemnus politus]|uniref:hypothetical protein n=1 Tax=Wolbachia endosymbiont of Atemnus politus TaxID=2682840 RepID=UPI001574B054|nr:hypothetical protein [Wolbachia endosymbiont of Atemnus politus]NSM56243.1 hypothetical protein [Wolbachia endosymbiont of Atemnus politus]NSX83016.1 hypothetical protein [Wolbachia endosymbiont of Atemnus politus]